MTVENNIDQFPVGMRVLAVDDDPTCLKVLETLLRKCQYNVTTTSQAVVALEMLRENRNRFDLVISDVHMPDMDGFKLLELVGLEMDLPVIMLSAYGDTKLVMKGISHGACDYLLKPIRIEELKNIWQHVIRRKKFDPKDQTDFEKPKVEPGELVEGFLEMGDPVHNGKLNRKRKDQNDDNEDEERGDDNENEDSTTQKKPRVVWSPELHRKFVAAVHHLGIDKAVPKKILDLMNVEKLSRENVASHLQKYRLYLKRISCVQSQQANMVAALGNDASYLRMASQNGLGNLPTLEGSGQFQNTAFGSFPPNSVFGRLNTPAGLGMRSLSSSGTVQFGHAAHTQNASNPNTGVANYNALLQTGIQNGCILQGMPLSMELDQLQLSQGLNNNNLVGRINDSMLYPISETKTNIGSSSNPHFPISDGFSDTKINVGGSINSLFGMPNNSLQVDGPHLQDANERRLLGNQSPAVGTSMNSGFSPHLSDIERFNSNWPNAVQSTEVQSNLYTLNDSCIQNNPMIMLTGNNNPHDVSSIGLGSARFSDGKTDFLHRQAGSGSSNSEQNMNFTLNQGWDDRKQDLSHQSNLLSSSMNSSLPNGASSDFLPCQSGTGSSNNIGKNMNVTLTQEWDVRKRNVPHQLNLLSSSLNSALPHAVAGPFNPSVIRSNGQLWRQL